jgi:NAD-dependent dihydropyrimidine dehydrogenase PreA subunit
MGLLYARPARFAVTKVIAVRFCRRLSLSAEEENNEWIYYVIAEPCVGVKDMSCVAVCPVDCIHGGEDSPQLYIDPEECIHCGICATECPVDAIFPVDELPAEWKEYEAINAHFYQTRRAGK